jgi:flavodoxin
MFRKKKKALIVYYTKTGHTADAAEAIARGLESSKVEATVKPISEVEKSELADYSMVALGSPTRGGRPARKVKKFMKGLDKKALRKKTATTFTSYYKLNGRGTLRRLKRLLKRRKAKKIIRGVKFKAGAPLSLWSGKDIKEKDIARLEALGKKLAKKGR